MIWIVEFRDDRGLDLIPDLTTVRVEAEHMLSALAKFRVEYIRTGGRGLPWINAIVRADD